jgi:hypothetical protein
VGEGVAIDRRGFENSHVSDALALQVTGKRLDERRVVHVGAVPPVVSEHEGDSDGR